MSTKASSDHKYNCYREENHGCLVLDSYPGKMFTSRKLGAPVQVDGSKVSTPQHTPCKKWDRIQAGGHNCQYSV